VKSLSISQREEIDSSIAVSIPGTIEPGSLDEYIYGCLSDVSELGTSCTPSCVNGYKVGDIEECSLSIYKKEGGVLRQLNKNKSSRAFLYVDNENDFTEKDARKLGKMNSALEEIFVYTRDEGARKYSHSHTHIVDRKPNKKNETPNLFYAIVFLLFIVVLFALAYFAYHQCTHNTHNRQASNSLFAQVQNY